MIRHKVETERATFNSAKKNEQHSTDNFSGCTIIENGQKRKIQNLEMRLLYNDESNIEKLLVKSWGNHRNTF